MITGLWFVLWHASGPDVGPRIMHGISLAVPNRHTKAGPVAEQLKLALSRIQRPSSRDSSVIWGGNPVLQGREEALPSRVVSGLRCSP